MPAEGGDFEIVPSTDPGEPWHAQNGMLAVSVWPSRENSDPSTRLRNGCPALLYKNVRLHWPPPEGQEPRRGEVLIAELNGVFVHLKVEECRVRVIVSDGRLN